MSQEYKPRSDSYEASLIEEKREALYALLSEPGLSLLQMQKLAPEWVGGQYDGKKPSLETLSNIATRLRTENMLLQVEATSKMLEAVSGKIKLAGHSEEVLDTALSLIGQEVIQKTLEDSDPKNRTAAVRLMLKRADQHRFDRRMSFLESQVKRATETLQDTKLSAEEQQLRMKEIFGMSS